jgi:hypothetical protein
MLFTLPVVGEWSTEAYLALLDSLGAAGASIGRSWYRESRARAQVVLRHDIDFSLELALRLARIECSAKVQATYFVHVRSPFYNVFSRQGVAALEEFADLGHAVGLHADLQGPAAQMPGQVVEQLDVLTRMFPRAITEIVSIHRPRTLSLDLSTLKLPAGIRHTYESEFISDGRYLADSGGRWGESGVVWPTLVNGAKLLQLLVHPVWWMGSGNSDSQKLLGIADLNAKVVLDNISKYLAGRRTQ